MTNPENNAPPTNKPADGGDKSLALPRPIVKKMRWPFPIIWIVPVAAAVLAGYYLYQHHREHGAAVTIEFDDGEGLTKQQTEVKFHGITIGQVQSVELSDDHMHAVAHVRLMDSAAFVARQETSFWIVRPEFSISSISGLNTLVSGPYIEVRPGGGPEATHFIAAPQEPIINGPGIKVVLHADTLGSVTLTAPVTYRGIQVGVVQDIRLSDVSDAANITIYVWQRYACLIRTNTEFWPLKAADIQGGLFGGLKLKIGSLRSLLTGGIAFATPEKNIGKRVCDGAQFNLNAQSKDAWLKWKPKIPIDPEEALMSKQKGPMAKEKSGSKRP
ncbi:MAG TPA: MlaD family protein [Tepidisphaeraceae bacterium]|jgi:paraquat-inducible protein B|nr:MlaD family protein [Tepidisphaeraceae bacterium]